MADVGIRPYESKDTFVGVDAHIDPTWIAKEFRLSQTEFLCYDNAKE